MSLCEKIAACECAKVNAKPEKHVNDTQMLTYAVSIPLNYSERQKPIVTFNKTRVYREIQV